MGLSGWDSFGLASVVILIAPLLCYYAILRVSYRMILQQDSSTQRIQILSTRTALFLPIYSIIIWVSLVAPVLYVPLQVPTALAEGYCFTCFFAMVVENLGGPDETVAAMVESGRRPLIQCCCPATPRLFFQRVQGSLFHFLWTRTVVVLVSVVCTFVSKHSQTYADPAFVASLVLTMASFALLINGFGSLVLFYEVVISESSNLLATGKIILLKISVGLIVIQGLIEEFLYAFGVISVQPSGNFSGQDRAQRFYCFIVLLEYACLSVAVYYAYAAEIKPSTRSPSRASKSSRLASKDAEPVFLPPFPSNFPTIVPPSPSPSTLPPSTSMSDITTASDADADPGRLSSLQSHQDGHTSLTFYAFLLLVFNVVDVFSSSSMSLSDGSSIQRPLIDHVDEEA